MIRLAILFAVCSAAFATSQEAFLVKGSHSEIIAGEASSATPKSGEAYIMSVLGASGKLSPERMAEVLRDFRKLPDGAKELLLGAGRVAWSPDAPESSRASFAEISAKLARCSLDQMAAPRLSGFVPARQAPGGWVIAVGNNYGDCPRIKWESRELPGYYWSWGDSPGESLLCFQVPKDAKRGDSYDVALVSSLSRSESEPKRFYVVAPVGFRGEWGFSFPDFVTEQIPWKTFRDHLGSASTEFPDGRRRPFAESFYNTSYKHLAASGNCFGFAQLCGATMRGEADCGFAKWLQKNSGYECVWEIPGEEAVFAGINQHQTLQAMGNGARALRSAWNTQNPNLVFEKTRELLAGGDYPLINVYSGREGHTLVAYYASESGTERKIYVYDPRKPYNPTESSDGDSVIRVDKATNSFRYQYEKGVWWSDKITVVSSAAVSGKPSIPGALAGSGDSTGYFTVSGGMVMSVSDRTGRECFGSEVNGKAAISEGVTHQPYTGGIVRGVLPDTFAFEKATSDVYTVTFEAGRAPYTASFCLNGLAVEISATGRSMPSLETMQFDFRSANPSVSFSSEATGRTHRVRLIQQLPDGAERVVAFDGVRLQPNAPVNLTWDAGWTEVSLRNLTSNASARCEYFASTSTLSAAQTLNRGNPRLMVRDWGTASGRLILDSGGE